jgi:hypothetical protein
MERLTQLIEQAGITPTEVKEILEQPVCPMYRKLADVLESRFERHSEEYKMDYTSRYAEDTDESLEEVITALFEAEGYNEDNFYVSDRSVFDNSGYDTGYCTISWISKHTKKLEAFDFQWEIV